jgi:hypothetical protein
MVSRSKETACRKRKGSQRSESGSGESRKKMKFHLNDITFIGTVSVSVSVSSKGKVVLMPRAGATSRSLRLDRSVLAQKNGQKMTFPQKFRSWNKHFIYCNKDKRHLSRSMSTNEGKILVSASSLSRSYYLFRASRFNDVANHVLWVFSLLVSAFHAIQFQPPL